MATVRDITDRIRATPSKLNPRLPQMSIFDKVRNDPKFTTARSIDWFRKKIESLGGNTPSSKYDLMRTTKDKQTNMFLPGALYIFKYDPKWKDELPFYDVFPCSLIFSTEGNLVRGINFHYLPYIIRGRLFDKLWQIAMVYRNNMQQSRRITWRLLSNVSKFPEVQPAVKSYLYSHIQSRLIKVDIDDWKTAMLLPVESFAKKSYAYVTRDSAAQIRNIVGKPQRPARR